MQLNQQIINFVRIDFKRLWYHFNRLLKWGLDLFIYNKFALSFIHVDFQQIM